MLFFSALYDSNKGKILDMLDRTYVWVQGGADDLAFGYYEAPGTPRYGRCAETHPIAGVM